jgi:transposase
MARRRHRQFSPEFRTEAVRLAQATDAPLGTIAQQLGIGKGTLYRWVEASRPAAAAPGGLTEDERTELGRLRRENLQLRMERDILKKATAFFARQSE